MPKERILVVEDDKHISKLIGYNLEKSGFDCRVASSGEEALNFIKSYPVDLVVLDIMLPGMDGFEVCRHLKAHDKLKSVPVIMLTAKGEEVDRIVGLELGADDYIVKPFSPRELLLRIKAILRRKTAPQEATEEKKALRHKNLCVDTERHKATVGSKEIELTPLEFRLLVTLMERRGRVQTRDRLLEDVWGMSSEADTRTIDTHIKRLREKIGPVGRSIETVRGLGYRFKEEP